MTWLSALAAAERDGEPCVLVTIVRTAGSAPRDAGAKMVVTACDQDDTIGGGALEHRCAAVARTLLGTAEPVMHDFPLGPALGQCCGGHVSVLFEPMAPPWRIALFGAGHVGQAVVRVLETLPCRVAWVDAREELFPARLPPNVHAMTAAGTLAPGTTLVVMTHDHALDFAIVEAALARPDLGPVLLIGSATKRARFARRLGAVAQSARFVCPIGEPGGKLPAEIAVAVAAELLRTRRQAPVMADSLHGDCKQGCGGCGR